MLKKYKTAIFIDGCFWHRHKRCKYAYIPKSRVDFWNNKFESNIKRDKKVKKKLKDEGWQVIRIWECETNENELLKSKIINKLI